ncbi:MAG: hypothetical protein ACI4UE_06060 [Candidatus Scatovivens sp.]
MNQILDYNPIGDNNNGSGKGSTDKIIKVFAIILITFAVCLTGIGIFNIIKNNTGINTEQVNESKADIKTSKDGSNLKISVSHDKKLIKLMYNWNTTPERTISIDSGNTFETSIEIPAGNNTLNIKVVDNNNGVTAYSEEISSEDGIDIINPVVSYEVTEDKKIKIKATDENALDCITYRWNDEDETEIKAEEENQKEIIIEIEIKKGENNLTIIAVDKANNTASTQQTFTGLTQPNIQVVLSEDKSKLVVTCTHENGISKVEYTLNDKPYAAELTDSPKEIQFEQALDEGYNKIILTVTSVDGTTTTFGGECNYNPDQSGLTIQ